MAGRYRGIGRQPAVLPIPNSFSQSQEDTRSSYAFLTTALSTSKGALQIGYRWTSAAHSAFSALCHTAKPRLAASIPEVYAETQDMPVITCCPTGMSEVIDKLKDTLLG